MTVSGQHLSYNRKLFVFLPREEMSVSHGHADVLMTHELLQLHDRNLPRLRQPRGEGMPHGVQGDGVQAVAILRGQFELSDGGLKAGWRLVKRRFLARLLEDGFRRLAPVRLEHPDHIFRHTDENPFASFLNDIEAAGVGIHVLPAQLENLRGPEAGSQREQSHVMQLRMPLFEIVQKGFGFLSGQEAQSFIVGFDHFPCAALGGQRIDAAPYAGGDGTVYGGAHEREDIVHGLPGQCFPLPRSGVGISRNLFELRISGGCGEQFSLEIGEQPRSQIGNRQIVNFGLKVGAVLTVVLVNILPFASAPFKVGVHELPDCHFVAGSRIHACGGDFGYELRALAFDHWRANTFAVPADRLPMTFALGIGIAETIDAIRLPRLGVALPGRQAVENALELGFYVFSIGYVAHGGMITTKNLKGKMVIHSLSKTDFLDKSDEDNYLFFMILLALFMAICEGQRERERERDGVTHGGSPALTATSPPQTCMGVERLRYKETTFSRLQSIFPVRSPKSSLRQGRTRISRKGFAAVVQGVRSIHRQGHTVL